MPSIAIPCLRYRDTPAAIDWLCEVFGFECQMAVPGIDGAIAHAQLTLDGGMVMLGSVSSEGEYGRLLAQPDEIGGRETQTVYLQVRDADRVCERAQRRRQHPAGAGGHGVRQSRLPVPRPRRPCVEYRDLRPVEARGLVQ